MNKRIENTQGNRGKFTEQLVIQANQIYLNKGVADIKKQSTPVKTIRGKSGKIEKAFYSAKTGVDFTGLIRGGQHIAFDCKETNNKTSYPISDIKQHQIDDLKSISFLGGLAFLIINFRTHGKAFILPLDKLLLFVEGNLKSMPLSYFMDKCKEIKEQHGCALDYLSALEYEKEENQCQN